MNKVDVHKSKIIGERVLLDLSYVKIVSLGGNHYFLMGVEQCSGFKWCDFMKKKNDLGDKVLIIIVKMNAG